MRSRIVASGGLLLAACPVMGQIPVYTETFSGNTNAGGWSFGAPTEEIQPTGGESGPYLRGAGLDTTIPFLSTGPGVASVFTGDYRARRVSFVRAWLNVFHTDFPIGSRAPALILYSNNGTPGDTSDDWGAFALSLNPLGPAGQWAAFGWQIQSQQADLPQGWSFIAFGPGAPPSPSWDTLVRHVDRLMISFGDPSLFYIFQMWDVGADTIVIERPSSCYANCDASTTEPFLNVLDFGCFLAHAAAGPSDTYANCDGSTTPPLVNVLDFGCFLNRFAAGCSEP